MSVHPEQAAMTRRWILLAVLVALAALAGCSSDEPRAETISVTTAPAETTTADDAPAVADEPTQTTAEPAQTGGRDCADFATQAEAQTFFEEQGGVANDVHQLDEDGDGIVCEALPAGDQPAEPAEPAGIGPGVYVVGTDIQPGTYRTDGPNGDVPFCYWARLKDTSGELDAIIANNNVQGPGTVTIEPGDGAFETQFCQPWVAR